MYHVTKRNLGRLSDSLGSEVSQIVTGHKSSRGKKVKAMEDVRKTTTPNKHIFFIPVGGTFHE